MGRGDLERLSKEELIEVLRLQRPEKTSRTSSKPPSTDCGELRRRPMGEGRAVRGIKRARSARLGRPKTPGSAGVSHLGPSLSISSQHLK